MGGACGLVARGVSPSRGGPTLQSGAELHVVPPRRDERERKREMPSLKIFVLLFSFEFLAPGAH